MGPSNGCSPLSLSASHFCSLSPSVHSLCLWLWNGHSFRGVNEKCMKFKLCQSVDQHEACDVGAATVVHIGPHTVSAICKSTLLLGASNSDKRLAGRQTDRQWDRQTMGDKCSDAAVKCLNFLESSSCCSYCCCCWSCCWPTAKTVEANCEAHFLCECDCQMSTELSNETLTFDRRTQNIRKEKKKNIFLKWFFFANMKSKGK